MGTKTTLAYIEEKEVLMLNHLDMMSTTWPMTSWRGAASLKVALKPPSVFGSFIACRYTTRGNTGAYLPTWGPLNLADSPRKRGRQKKKRKIAFLFWGTIKSEAALNGCQYSYQTSRRLCCDRGRARAFTYKWGTSTLSCESSPFPLLLCFTAQHSNKAAKLA